MILIEETFTNAHDEVCERLQLDKHNGCHVERQRLDEWKSPLDLVAELCDALGQVCKEEMTSVSMEGEREREREDTMQKNSTKVDSGTDRYIVGYLETLIHCVHWLLQRPYVHIDSKEKWTCTVTRHLAKFKQYLKVVTASTN